MPGTELGNYPCGWSSSVGGTRPWTGEVIFVKSEGPLFEYACHEGNEGMSGILAGARTEEKKAAARPQE